MRMTNHDPGYQPWVISANKPTWRAIYDKLCEYEDAEEQGRLVILPCKAGDTVWEFDSVGRLYKHTVNYAFLTADKMIFDTDLGISFDASALGDSLFLSREEAEAALKGESKKETPTIIPAEEGE